MALTKEDIETAIDQTENQDAIKHSLSNYFEGLDEPVAVAISLNGTAIRLNREEIETIVNALREKGIDIVSTMDSDAALPDKFIVSDEGIQTPFLSPKDALKAATIIEDVVCNQETVRLSGHANLLSNDSIVYAADKKTRNLHSRGLDLLANNPKAEQIPEILSKYGESMEDFIDRKINEAYANAVTIDMLAEQERNARNGRDTLWRGATFIGKPYASIYNRNARRVAYASSMMLTSSGYTGYSGTSSGQGGAWFPKTKSGKNYGCLYKFKSLGDEQIYYADTGLEAASGGHTFQKDEIGLGFETAVYKHKNELEAMYLQVGPSEFYSVPVDKSGNILDAEWRDFAALHEPSDDNIYGYEAVRRNSQKQEQDADENHCYKFELHSDLTPKNYSEKHFSAEEIANAVAYRGNISRDETGHIGIHQDVKIDVNTANADLKNITVWGTCSLYNTGKMSILDMPNIQETPTGLSTKIDIRGNGLLTDVDKVSTDDLLKVIGGWSKDKNYETSVISIPSHITLDALPQDFNEHSYNEVSINCTVDTIQDFPNTIQGCYGFKVRNQKTIEDMDPDLFETKIMGSFGAKSYTEGNHILYLRATNITTLPKGMRDKSFDKVTLNPEYTVSSLDNFPKTKEGISGINFEGSLGNLTMEEFLIKVKGENWCKKNISKDDGDKFTIRHWDLKADNFKITDYPKDIAKYRFDSDVIDNDIAKEWNLVSNKAKFAEKIKLPEVCLTSYDSELLKSVTRLDLTHCTDISLSNVDLSHTKVILPKDVAIYIGENVKFALDFKLDLSHNKDSFVHHSVECAEVKLPQRIMVDDWAKYTVPQQTTEITTSCMKSSHCIFNIPPHVKIIDTPDKNGKKIPLKTLKACGLSKEQIATLRKERIKNMFRSPSKTLKPVPIAQDIAAMSRETGTAAFIYNDIHNSKVDNEFHYDYKKVIDGVSKAQKITPLEAEKKLLEYGILTPLPKGEYAINVENISNGVNFGGEVVFSYSKADVKTQYHEMAHSYQAKDGLFSDAVLDKIYASEAQKNNGSPADRKSYTEYLHEIHANAFACAASMLRSSTPLEIKATELDTRLHGDNRTAGAYLVGLAQQDIKKYASQPVMKQLVKEMQQIRAQGKRQEYFRADGTLDGSKLAKLCERVVIDSAWKPSTYQSYMDNKISKNDGWSKDVGKAILRAPLTLGASNLLNGKIFRGISKVYTRMKHNKLKKQEINKLKAFVQQRMNIKDPQRSAVHEYERLQAQVRITASMLRIGNANNFVADKLRAMQNMSDKELVETKNLFAKYGSAKAIKELQVAQNIIEQNKDNPYFQKIMENPANIAEMRQGSGKVAEKSKESPAQELSLTDKEKIAALSGRTGTKPNYAAKDTEAPTQTQTSEQVKSAAQEISQPAQSITPPQHQAVNTPQQQTNLAPQNAPTAPTLSKQQDVSAPSAEKVADMSKKEKGNFFHKLRLGINIILAKAEAQLSPEKTVSQTKTQAHTSQQLNVAQMKMAKDRGKSI